MKKKILIVSSSLSTGGLEKCIINLCNNLDYEKYEIDLYLFNEGRTLLPELNKRISILPDSPFYASVYNRPIIRGCIELIKHNQIHLCVYRILRTIRSRLGMNLITIHDWEVMKKTMLKNDKKYDVAIGFEEGTANYYIIECANALIKNCWIHTDVMAIETNYQLDRNAFRKCNHICTVSKNSANSIKEKYPEFSEKIKIFSLPSLFDTKCLFEKANENAGFDINSFNIVSVGRLVELKGFQLCIKVCKKLIDNGYKLKWYVVGEGEYRTVLEQLIRDCNIDNSVILLGNCDNPYKYIKAADICVQPSSYEGYGLVVYEEKLLEKPVILSDIPSFKEMITNGVNGIIVERSINGIYNAIIKVYYNTEYLHKLGKCPINGYKTKEMTMKQFEETMKPTMSSSRHQYF